MAEPETCAGCRRALDDLEKRMLQMFADRDHTLTMTAEVLEKRLEAMDLGARVSTLENTTANTQGKSAVVVGVAVVIAWVVQVIVEIWLHASGK